MIQRKQTLFLLQLAFLSISLLFIPIQFITGSEAFQVTLLPAGNGEFASTTGHLAAVGLNAIGLILSVITIFLFKNRPLQLRLCYILMVIYIVLPLMMAFCPFISIDGTAQKAEVNVFGHIVSAVSIVSAYLAARFIKKDIDLIKSADRIR